MGRLHHPLHCSVDLFSVGSFSFLMLILMMNHLHDLVPLLHTLLLRRAVWLNPTDKDAHVVPAHEPQTHAALLHERHPVHIRAVPEEIEGTRGWVTEGGTLAAVWYPLLMNGTHPGIDAGYESGGNE